MTFTEFCSTRCYAKDLGAALGETSLDGIAGFFYAGGLYVSDSGAYPLYIADRGAAVEAGEQRWRTVIEQRNIPGAQLANLEWSLYRFAKESGFLRQGS